MSLVDRKCVNLLFSKNFINFWFKKQKMEGFLGKRK